MVTPPGGNELRPGVWASTAYIAIDGFGRLRRQVAWRAWRRGVARRHRADDRVDDASLFDEQDGRDRADLVASGQRRAPRPRSPSPRAGGPPPFALERPRAPAASARQGAAPGPPKNPRAAARRWWPASRRRSPSVRVHLGSPPHPLGCGEGIHRFVSTAGAGRGRRPARAAPWAAPRRRYLLLEDDDVV